MLTKENLYIFEKEILDNIGLIIPFNNIIINKDISNFTYNPQTKHIHIPKVKLETDNVIITKFNISHEFGHLIIDFILNSGIDINNFTKQDLENSLNNFFKTKDRIMVAEEQCNKFKEFIEKSPFKDKDFYKHLEFDDKFYVSGSKIGSSTNSFKNAKYYLMNSNEILSNYFASNSFVNYIEKYSNENKYVWFKEFQSALNDCIKPFDIDITKTKSEFNKQISLFKKYEHKLFIKNRPKYTDYNFAKSCKILNNMIQKMKGIVKYIELNNKTPEQRLQEQEEIDLAKEQLLNNKLLKNIKIINNFMPNREDKNKYMETSFTTIENQVKITSTQTIPNIVETIVDLKNKKNYLFHKERTKMLNINTEKEEQKQDIEQQNDQNKHININKNIDENNNHEEL